MCAALETSELALNQQTRFNFGISVYSGFLVPAAPSFCEAGPPAGAVKGVLRTKKLTIPIDKRAASSRSTPECVPHRKPELEVEPEIKPSASHPPRSRVSCACGTQVLRTWATLPMTPTPPSSPRWKRAFARRVHSTRNSASFKSPLTTETSSVGLVRRMAALGRPCLWTKDL